MADKFLRNKVITGLVLRAPDGNSWSPYLTGNDYYPKLIFFNGNKVSVKSKFDDVSGTSFENLMLSSDDVVIESPVNGWGVSFENLRVTLNNKKTVFHFKVLEPETIELTLSDNFYRLADMISLNERVIASEPDKNKYLKKSWEY